MKKRLYVKLVSPSILRPVKATDPLTGKTDQVIAGIRRYSPQETPKVIEDFLAIIRNKDEEDLIAKMEELEVLLGISTEPDAVREELTLLVDKIKAVQEKKKSALETYLRSQVTQIKGASLEEYDDVGVMVGELHVDDSATAEPNDYWTSPTECLQVLLEHYIQFGTPWFRVFQQAFEQTLQGRGYEEERSGN